MVVLRLRLDWRHLRPYHSPRSQLAGRYSQSYEYGIYLFHAIGSWLHRGVYCRTQTAAVDTHLDMASVAFRGSCVSRHMDYVVGGAHLYCDVPSDRVGAGQRRRPHGGVGSALCPLAPNKKSYYGLHLDPAFLKQPVGKTDRT